MFWQQLLIVAGIHLLAVMSPGPDFLMIMRNSLVYSRKTGMYSAVGLGMGIMVHVFYSLVGIGVLISKSVILFTIIKYLGAGYLIYIGWKSIFAKQSIDHVGLQTKQGGISNMDAIKMGFLTNVLNPKASLFFLALFTQVITPSTPLVYQTIYGVEMVVATISWFMLVAYILSHTTVRTAFRRMQHRAEQVFGLLLIGLGVKVALSSQN